MRQIVEIVKRTYCGTFALQYMHISDPEQAAWLKERGDDAFYGHGDPRSVTYLQLAAGLDSHNAKVLRSEKSESWRPMTRGGSRPRFAREWR